MNMTKKIMIIGLLISTSSWAETKISKIEFFGKNDPQQIVVTADGPIDYEKIDNPQDKQIILEIKNAKFSNTNASRILDSSSIDGKVVMISPYAVEQSNAIRVVIQLRENADLKLLSKGNKIFAGVDGEPDPAVAAAVLASEANNASDEIKTVDAKTQIETGTGSKFAEKSLNQFEESQKTKKFIGSKITVQFRDVDIVDVFRLIGEASGFNMVIGNDVSGKITLSLVDVPWDQVLDMVLTTNRLGAERNENILRIASLGTLTAEKQQQLAAKVAADANAPRITRIFPISYATPNSLIPILTRFGTGTAGSGQGGSRDTIVVDDRTNSLIIQDIPENINRMAKIIELLDKPTPQVLVEAKIVEASEEFTKSIGGSVGAAAVGLNNGAYAFGFARDGGIFDPLLSGNPVTGAAFPPTGTSGANSLGFGLKIRSLSNLRINTALNLSETESKTKILSSPRIVVQNKQRASIVQGTPVLVPVTVTNPTTGTTNVQDTVQAANLSLNVTPTVTNDGNVLLELSVSNDSPQALGNGQTGISNRSVNTRVMTPSGETLVIGGVYRQSTIQNEGGFPLLRKIPLLGLLFGTESKNDTKSELFIFITPRVLNEKEVAPVSDFNAG